MKKILITGSSGFLGSRLAYLLKDKFDLLLPAHNELNVSHEEAVRSYLEEHAPEVVIHCAALSNTWYCEQHPEESHKVNVQGTIRVAKACKLMGLSSFSCPAIRCTTALRCPARSKRIPCCSLLTYMVGINWRQSSALCGICPSLSGCD